MKIFGLTLLLVPLCAASANAYYVTQPPYGVTLGPTLSPIVPPAAFPTYQQNWQPTINAVGNYVAQPLPGSNGAPVNAPTGATKGVFNAQTPGNQPEGWKPNQYIPRNW